MISSLLILLPVVGLVTWMYFRFAPKHVPRRLRMRYDAGVLFLAILACASAVFYAYKTVGAGVDYAWWPVMATLFALVSLVLVVTLGGLVRNFIMFRSHR